MKRNLKDYGLLVLKGMGMGAALFWKQRSGSACEKVGDSAAVLTVVGDGNGQAWKKAFSS
jgi:hypothetical protein